MAQEPVTVAVEGVDLYAPFTPDTLLEVRSGKVKPLKGLCVTTKSGIDKSIHDSPVYVNTMGIEGDEHDYTFHGGADKAIHGYCSSHYPSWQKEFPSAASRFVPGGFGENFVTARMNERNVCIGDHIAVGDELLLEVSLPRQPCFKLNHRFELKDFAPNTWKLSRTGWYYRVIRPGTVKAGDQVRLVERRYPQWTIERIQEFLHRNQDNVEMNEELAAIEELGIESRELFRNRALRQRAKERRAAAGEKEHAQPAPKWRDFKIVEKKRQTPTIVSIVLEAVEPLTGPEEADLDPGAHAQLKLGNGLVRAYSVVDGDQNMFQLGIALDKESRGGSEYLHKSADVGSIVKVGNMTAAVPLVSAASNHVFVAAGIGLTAFLSLVEVYKSINYSAILHYAVRSADEVPFRERIDKLGDNVVVYDKSAGQRLDICSIIKNMQWNSQLYFCGPKRLMEEAAREVKASGIPEKEVHFEAFSADLSGDPFQAVVANRGNKVLKVDEDETLLEVLQLMYGEAVASSCSVGNCGTCRISYTEGRVEHRGTALIGEEKATSMLACVSRGVGRITIEI
ncbi:MOSC domain-containing protein [Bombardia bombarda]|uniref:MOSC domain-containing protein n=1 Tax=Bombardia bombarda TaxID=252184 RepID=A0AA40CF72_9PEZI|nr:MOSC domain-containing protein [Bombardia bombarda]